MKKASLLIFLFLMTFSFLHAQKVEYRITAGVNTTMMSDFTNPIVISDGLIVPGLYTPANSSNFVVYT